MITACDQLISTSDDPKTVVIFDNTNGTCTAVVYNSHFRTEESKITEVEAGKKSKEIGWTPDTSVPFFFSYKINLIDIQNLTINYIPEIGRDQVHMRIDADKKTAVTIPALAQTLSSLDLLLSDDSYLLIQNNSSFPIQLQRGNTAIQPENISSIGVNPGERALYTLLSSDNRSVSLYQLSESAKISSFTVPSLNFESGHVYSFTYNGSSVSLITITSITNANTISGTIPGAPSGVSASVAGQTITVNWNFVSGATGYHIYRSTRYSGTYSQVGSTSSASSTSFTDTGLDGGVTYHYRVAAYNNNWTTAQSSSHSVIASWRPKTPSVKRTSESSNSISFNWEAVPGATGYYIYRSIGLADKNYSLYDRTTISTSYSETGLSGATVYNYTVAAYNSYGTSNQSSSIIKNKWF